MSGCMFSNNVSRYAGATLNLSASSQAYLSGRGHLTPLDQSGRLLLNSSNHTTISLLNTSQLQREQVRRRHAEPVIIITGGIFHF